MTLFAKIVIAFLKAKFAAHGCTNFEDTYLMEQVIIRDTCHARADFVCAAFSPNLSNCGMHWVDKCTILKPGPSAVCN